MKPLALVLVLALSGGAARAEESCTEALDAGVPPPAVLVEPGYVVSAPSWVLSPGRMCLVGQALGATCELGMRAYVLLGAASFALGVLGGLALAWATGHLR